MVVYQLDAGVRRLIYVGKSRTTKTLLRFFFEFGKERTTALKFICSDIWKPYLKVIAKKAPQALTILDRFHIVSHLTKAINQVRIDEVKRLKDEGYDEAILRHTKHCFLKNPENLTPNKRRNLTTFFATISRACGPTCSRKVFNCSVRGIMLSLISLLCPIRCVQGVYSFAFSSILVFSAESIRRRRGRTTTSVRGRA